MLDKTALTADEAALNITWQGGNGDLPDAILFDTTDVDVRASATEAVRTGYVPGITADEGVDFRDFTVDRFPANDGVPYNQIFLRPKSDVGLED